LRGDDFSSLVSAMIELEVVEGRATGKVFELEGDTLLLGRSESCAVRLDDDHLAGRHARIAVGLDEATIEDLGSSSGTALLRDGERIELSADDGPHALMPGDVVELGNDDARCRLAVRLRDEEKSTTVALVKPVGEVSASDFEDDPLTLRRLYDAQIRVGRAGELDAVLDALAEVAFDLVAHATHVTVVLEAEDVGATSEARKTAVRNYLPVLTRARAGAEGADGEAHGFVPITRSVYRKVLKERAAVLAADVPKELAATPSIMGARVRSTIALPLWRGEHILGVLQVDNRDAPGMLKPRDLEVLLVVAEHASLALSGARMIQRLRVAEERLRQENRFLKDRALQRRGGGERTTIIGDSQPMKQLMSQIDKVCDTNVTVLIEGDTGTGKELIAAALHDRSRRRDKLFVAQNCAALAESLLESELFGHRRGAFTGATEDKKGLFELADGSTLFLDEITEAPMAIQSKLLRALQEGEIRAVGATRPNHVNVRVVAATNRNLEAEVEAGRFREDLYYRLKVFPLKVPPLRERRSDIPLLIQAFLARYAAELGKPVAGMAPETLNMMVAYDWPGNVRELQNEVQRLVIQATPGAFVTPELLSSRMRRGEQLVSRAGGAKGTLKETMTAVEKYLVLEALRAHDNNKTSTAKSLGITREGLHKKLRGYDA
jgi:Nif-specific regulatory protein